MGASIDARWATVNSFPGITGSHRLSEGVPVGADFPPSVELSLAPNWGSLTTGFLNNTRRLMIAEERAKQFLERQGLDEPSVEYLPFILRNKKGRVVDKQYYVVNPLRKFDCLDRGRSDFRTRADGVTVVVVASMRVHAERIPEDAKLFRLGEKPRIILLRSDLLEGIRAEGFSGVAITAMGEEFL